MYPASSDGLNRETDDAVYFFTPAFEVLNNFSAHQIEIWGKTFPTVEHGFHWKKYHTDHSEIAEAIMIAKSPDAAKNIAATHVDKLPNDWHTIKIGYMEELLRAKVEQHEDVRELLLKTGTRTIIENSPFDSFWGCGPDGTGKNMIGKLWMKIREEIK